MSQVTEGQPLTDEARAYALGQLSVVKSIATWLMEMPIVALDRSLLHLDKEFSAGVRCSFGWGTMVRREDLEIARLLLETRKQIAALTVARAANAHRQMMKVTSAKRD